MLRGKLNIVITKYKITFFCDSKFFHRKDCKVLGKKI